LVRLQILDTVIGLLGESSLDHMSMASIAHAADVSLRTLYRYFSTRDELVAAASDELRSRLGITLDINSPDEVATSFWETSALVSAQPRLARAMIYTETGRAARRPMHAVRIGAVTEALAPLTSQLSPTIARRITAVIAHLCGLAPWLTISDESDLSASDARAAVYWAIDVLIAQLKVEVEQARLNQSADSSAVPGDPIPG
jgi:AcrR family transcriptional regulator